MDEQIKENLTEGIGMKRKVSSRNGTGNSEPKNDGVSRRDFLRNTALVGSGIWATGTCALAAQAATGPAVLVAGDAAAIEEHAGPPVKLPDLSPARWLWYPSQRCLANTMVLFRRELQLPAKPKRATGWVLGSSRYLLYVNGRRIQFGRRQATLASRKSIPWT